MEAFSTPRPTSSHSEELFFLHGQLQKTSKNPQAPIQNIHHNLQTRFDQTWSSRCAAAGLLQEGSQLLFRPWAVGGRLPGEIESYSQKGSL